MVKLFEGELGALGSIDLTDLCADEKTSKSELSTIMHRSGWIRLVSFDYIWHNVIVSRSRDGISARRVGRHGDGFTI